MLSLDGSMCWITTYPIPVFSGSAWKSEMKASRPPADAPIPAMGNTAFSFFPETGRYLGEGAVLAGFFALFFPLGEAIRAPIAFSSWRLVSGGRWELK